MIGVSAEENCKKDAFDALSLAIPRQLPFVGPGLRGLDPGDVHICADTEEAWPILDWNRSCISLEQLVSSLSM